MRRRAPFATRPTLTRRTRDLHPHSNTNSASPVSTDAAADNSIVAALTAEIARLKAPPPRTQFIGEHADGRQLVEGRVALGFGQGLTQRRHQGAAWPDPDWSSAASPART